MIGGVGCSAFKWFAHEKNIFLYQNYEIAVQIEVFTSAIVEVELPSLLSNK